MTAPPFPSFNASLVFLHQLLLLLLLTFALPTLQVNILLISTTGWIAHCHNLAPGIGCTSPPNLVHVDQAVFQHLSALDDAMW